MGTEAGSEMSPLQSGIFQDLLAAVGPVADQFISGGYRLYLVGGLVRDRLLGDEKTPDYDLTTDATPDRIQELVGGVADAIWLQGERFGTVGVRVGEIDMEITTHRSEAYVTSTRKPVVSYTKLLAEDLERRDFTVNAMAVDVADETLYDPHGGRSDLMKRILQTPLDPVESFSDDPLRMFRAARFLSRYNLTPADGLVDAARSLTNRIEIVSTERIRDELFRLLAVDDPIAGFELLETIGLLSVVLPDVADLSVRARRDLLRRMVLGPSDPIIRLALLAHGSGGEAAIGRWAKQLRLSGRDLGRASALLEGVSRVGDMAEVPTDTELRRLAAISGEYLDEVVLLSRLVHSSGGPSKQLVHSVLRLRNEGELEDLGPSLDGTAVMDLLGLDAGPEVGEVLAWLTELRMTEGRLKTEEVTQRLLDWWSRQNG